MSNMGCIMWGMSVLLNLNRKYKNICNEPDLKANTVYFGKYSMVASVVSGAIFLLCVWGTAALIAAVHTASVGEMLMWVFVAMQIILTVVVFAEFIMSGLMGVVYQFRCNTNKIRYAALAVFAAMTAIMIAGTVLIVGAVK